MTIAIIAAMSQNGVIGCEGRIPWHLPKDFAHFKKLTMGHPIIMGRKTFESLPGMLPNRKHIVVTRGDFSHEGCETADSLESAICIAAKLDSVVFIIGGGEIYKQALEFADVIYLTVVCGTFKGDTYFPAISAKEWRNTHRILANKDEKNSHDMIFYTYERKI